jgi:glucose-6-phosphate 1-dehydrogenase
VAQPTAPPCTVVIIGATGDLAKRKLLPAFYNLASRRLLPDDFRVVGVGRAPNSTDLYRAKVKQDLATYGTLDPDPRLWEWLEPRLSYVSETLGDAQSAASLAAVLKSALAESQPPSGLVFYLATPPSAVADIVARLGEAGLLNEDHGGFRRVVIEKPFGHDLASALALNGQLRERLEERQIYRIDHYLGKETVQNIMALRFGNGIFEPVWNRRYIDSVQITVAEIVGVENRAAYYDQAGALRDMVQNHMFQLLALTAMEPPFSFEADAVRNERVKVLHAIHRFTPDEVRASVVRGQYSGGSDNGDRVPAYLDEPGVPHGSATETYLAMRLTVDNWRWAGVPFYLRTGKRLPRRVTEVAVQFNRPPLALFRQTPMEEGLQANQLVIGIQPHEGISLQFEAKVPGAELRLGTVKMAFNYADYFSSAPETGYETLLYDCMIGDPTLFHRADMVEAGWKAVAPIQEILASEPGGMLYPYQASTWGPAESEALLARDRRTWRYPDP